MLLTPSLKGIGELKISQIKSSGGGKRMTSEILFFVFFLMALQKKPLQALIHTW